MVTKKNTTTSDLSFMNMISNDLPDVKYLCESLMAVTASSNFIKINLRRVGKRVKNSFAVVLFSGERSSCTFFTPNILVTTALNSIVDEFRICQKQRYQQ